MAIRDFNLYLVNVQAQVLATKNDLADFEQGLKDGHVTEQQVEDLRAEYQEGNRRDLRRNSYQGKHDKCSRQVKAHRRIPDGQNRLLEKGNRFSFTNFIDIFISVPCLYISTGEELNLILIISFISTLLINDNSVHGYKNDKSFSTVIG